jgi:two-component system sensor histidine kinase EvgS
MHEPSADQPPQKRIRALRVESMRTRVRIGAPGGRILAQSARAIAQSRELEVRVRQLEAQFRTSEGRVVKLADATLATLATLRSAHALAQNDLVAAVSYDLRTPLQAILGYAELMAAGATRELAETREFARRIVISSLSLAHVVENLIQLSAAQLGRMQLDIGSFDLKRLIADVVRLADPLARHKGITLRTDLVPLAMTSDRRRIRQIVTNLVENAITRTETGEVVVGLAAAEAPDHTTARITVRDSGPAIDASDLSDALASFREGRQPVTSSKQDAGLALSTVSHLTRLLGGEVRVEAEPGGGSTFTVQLPRVAPATESLAG